MELNRGELLAFQPVSPPAQGRPGSTSNVSQLRLPENWDLRSFVLHAPFAYRLESPNCQALSVPWDTNLGQHRSGSHNGVSKTHTADRPLFAVRQFGLSSLTLRVTRSVQLQNSRFALTIQIAKLYHYLAHGLDVEQGRRCETLDVDPIRACSVVNKAEKLDSQAK